MAAIDVLLRIIANRANLFAPVTLRTALHEPYTETRDILRLIYCIPYMMNPVDFFHANRACFDISRYGILVYDSADKL